MRRDPQFFERLCAIRRPDYLWIGCSDSRVPANTIVGLEPGKVFVHRNVANIVRADDPNCLSVLQYAVDALGVTQFIVCGHCRCGGVQAALGPASSQPLEGWFTPLREIHRSHAGELAVLVDDVARRDRLCELHVIAQFRTVAASPTVRAAWQRGQRLVVHGWIYDLHDGLLRDLGVSTDGG